MTDPKQNVRVSLAELERLDAARGVGGPWSAEWCDNGMEGDAHWRVVGSGLVIVAFGDAESDEMLARYIAAAANALPALVACLRDLCERDPLSADTPAAILARHGIEPRTEEGE